jgi:TIR domain
LPRLFISHSNKDSIHALAFQGWLELKGWSRDDVFIDLHDMQAGERWRETLVKANVACEALIFLASPESLASDECRREVRRAEDDRKEVIVAILRDVTIDHPRLANFRDRQIMDLSTNPREERVEVEHEGQRHLIDFNRAALNAIHAKLIDRRIAPDAFAWPPRHNPGPCKEREIVTCRLINVPIRGNSAFPACAPLRLLAVRSTERTPGGEPAAGLPPRLGRGRPAQNPRGGYGQLLLP